GMGGAQFLSQMQSGDPAQIQQILSGILLIILIGIGLYVPVLMGLWFAPAHMVFGNCGVMEAIEKSFKGCVANIIPFLVYGVVGLILSILASIPLMLGWLVLFPMVAASVYIAYKEIFVQAAAGR
ncbi:MAG: BPSS1780 family membrane protein, partial [Gammaproteobacteria bacterium]